MDEDTKPPILDTQEVSWLVQAFLQHPSRVKNGATEEEILKVINWAHELKIDLLVPLGILYEIYSGTLVLDIKGDEVVMSVAPKGTQERNPEDTLNFESLMKLL